jgi:citrate/tricarballylate utilization protein
LASSSGPAGLAWLARRREPATRDATQERLGLDLCVLLLLTSVSGLMLLAWRTTAAMPWLLAVHLGFVLGLFLSLPHGKFVHALYRIAALARHALERRRPHVAIGGDG